MHVFAWVCIYSLFLLNTIYHFYVLLEEEFMSVFILTFCRSAAGCRFGDSCFYSHDEPALKTTNQATLDGVKGRDSVRTEAEIKPQGAAAPNKKKTKKKKPHQEVLMLDSYE